MRRPAIYFSAANSSTARARVVIVQDHQPPPMPFSRAKIACKPWSRHGVTKSHGQKATLARRVVKPRFHPGYRRHNKSLLRTRPEQRDAPRRWWVAVIQGLLCGRVAAPNTSSSGNKTSKPTCGLPAILIWRRDFGGAPWPAAPKPATMKKYFYDTPLLGKSCLGAIF